MTLFGRKMISLTCKACGQQLQAPEESAGKTSACPKCRLPVTVPARIPIDDPLAGFDEFIAQNGSSGKHSAIVDHSGGELIHDEWHLGLAAVMSFFLPGLGQIYKRRIARGLAIQAVMGVLLGIGGGLFAIALISIPVSRTYPLVLFIVALVSIVAAIYLWVWQLFDAGKPR